MAPQANLGLLRAHGAVAAVARFSISRRSRVQIPIQKTALAGFTHLQINLTLASDLVIRGDDPMIQALRTLEFPEDSVLFQHMFKERFALWTHPAVRKLLFQQRDVLFYSVQTLCEVKVNLLPWKLLFFGFSWSSVFTVNPGSSGDGERRDGGLEKLLVGIKAVQEPPRRKTSEFCQGHFSNEAEVSLLSEIRNKEHLWTDGCNHKYVVNYYNPLC